MAELLKAASALPMTVPKARNSVKSRVGREDAGRRKSVTISFAANAGPVARETRHK
jgi:hypothetical protein